MSKTLKIVGTVAAISAGVAGGLFLYNKLKKNKNEELDEFDDYDDDFSDDEVTETEAEV